MTRIKRFSIVAAAAAAFVLPAFPASPASAHNHINPSGACNQSPDGADGPGATSGLSNPGNGRVIAKTQAAPVAQGDEHC